ncbi:MULTISPECIES: type II toxin-antitoxin system Phd/YefM family antitoxin [Mycobacterium]|uniref:type II toxin-antitoxin system Phd/YefM family antitoxin n=1 Tax=Mycobacterium TaxID=1763 RepID=UPI0015E1C333|nr:MULTISPECIES: type II toxin-antitoxin system prevent-host-death family antitoxin [Mycobacterium]MCV7100907.1 type II toxin-antitoxin system Phd/YefM family antitoxin [Mycobacterium palustre]MDV3215722.1 type II toxin-antitoxin system Phd/YefM family antitoxin [Mycobacterium avium]
MMIDHRDVVGVTELANSSSRLVAQAAQGRDVIIAKNNRPTAALVGIDRLQEIEDREENAALLILTLTRLATDNGNRTDLDDFIDELGLTGEVAALDDDDEDGDE